MVRRLFLLSLLTACSRELEGKGDGPVASDDDADADTDTDTDSDADTDADSDTDVPPADLDGDGVTDDRDCDDTDATVYPGAEEVCDGLDNDCNGRVDADEDFDLDGTADCDDYCPVYAAPGAPGDGRMIDPIGTIQAAVDLAGASGCNEVRAFQGTYYENVNWNGWPVNAESVSGPNNTIIDGQSLDSVVAFETSETSDARLYGFTITHGGGGDGPGLRIRYSDPVIEGNVITDNVANSGTYLGGGIRVYEGSPTIIDNEITGNDAYYGGPENGSDGGGINLRGGAAYIAGNRITDNSAGDGGGIWTAYSDALIVDNVISGNWADDVPDATELEKDGQGGGINVQVAGATGPTIAGNVITDNVASWYGGGIVTYEFQDAYPVAQIYNNTIAYNDVTDTDYGAGICQWRRTTPDVYNNVVYGNHGTGIYSEDGITVSYNLVYANDTDFDGAVGTNTVADEPNFTSVTDDGDWSNDDFSVRAGSPTLDAGDPAVLDTDGSRSDIGAYGGPYPFTP